MFLRIRDALRHFFYGRNGVDALGIALLIVGALLLIGGRYLAMLLLMRGAPWYLTLILPVLAFAALGFGFLRAYSKNLVARSRENAWFLRLIAPLRDRGNRYFRCPKCRQSVRVRCPKCGNQFEKKT